MEPFIAVSIVLLIVALALFLFWIYAIAPRTKNRPSFEALKNFDYAHRGLHGDGIPENSLPAFSLAANKGFGMELDLQLTKDGFVVVHHDNSLKRICGTGRLISDLTLKELQLLHLGDSGETVPLFTDVLAAVGGRTPIIVELKGYGDTRLLCEKAWEILKDYRGLYCIESFHPQIVAWFRKNQPQIIRGQLMSAFQAGDDGLNAFTAYFARNLFTNVYTRPDFEAYHYKDRHKAALRLARRLFCMQEVSWTLRDAESYLACKNDGCICIFEGFDPQSL